MGLSSGYRHGFYGVLVLMLHNNAVAADLANTQATAVSYGQVANLVLGLVLVLLAFLCVVYVLKRLPGGGGVTSRGHLKIVDALALSTRERLLLVKVADTYLVLGVSSGAINALHVVKENLDDRVSEPNPDFKSQLQNLFALHKTKGS